MKFRNIELFGDKEIKVLVYWDIELIIKFYIFFFVLKDGKLNKKIIVFFV